VKRTPEYLEGFEAWGRYQSAMKKVIAVPHAEIQHRVEEQREHAKKSPNKRAQSLRSFLFPTAPPRMALLAWDSPRPPSCRLARHR
jgi:hypothetical protein